jgi:hypothetical protein
MVTYEITWVCTDEDWIYRRVECEDFHAACDLAMRRVFMAASNPHDKLKDARVHRIQRIE